MMFQFKNHDQICKFLSQKGYSKFCFSSNGPSPTNIMSYLFANVFIVVYPSVINSTFLGNVSTKFFHWINLIETILLYMMPDATAPSIDVWNSEALRPIPVWFLVRTVVCPQIFNKESGNLSPIHKNPLQRFERFLQKRKIVPFSNGFCPYLSPLIVASPSIPFPRSTIPVYPHIRHLDNTHFFSHLVS